MVVVATDGIGERSYDDCELSVEEGEEGGGSGVVVVSSDYDSLLLFSFIYM